MTANHYATDKAANDLRNETLVQNAIRQGINTNEKLQTELNRGRRHVCNILRRLKTRGQLFFNTGTRTWAFRSDVR